MHGNVLHVWLTQKALIAESLLNSAERNLKMIVTKQGEGKKNDFGYHYCTHLIQGGCVWRCGLSFPHYNFHDAEYITLGTSDMP